MNYTKFFTVSLLAAFSLLACSSSSKDEPEPIIDPVVTPDPTPDPTPEPDPTPAVSSDVFAKGADISWVTEMESKGEYFYTADGTKTDCFELMKQLGLNSVRLRVWVDPKDHGDWCNKADVVAKAVRAKAAGLDVMIDFHYSDYWADPGQQHKPAAWKGLGLADLKKALADHTTDVLQAIKDKGVDVKWVQVGNEIRPGMLWDEDVNLSGASYDIRYCDVKEINNPSTEVAYRKNLANLGAFIATGYDAVKTVYPEAKVIVHIDRGHEDNTWFYDAVKQNGGNWDMIGLSLYPYWANWGLSASEKTPDDTIIANCISQLTKLYNKYGTEVMIVEVGMQCADGNGNLASQSILDEGKRQLTEILTKCQALTYCKGVFYWEPECRPKQYQLGAFDAQGRPTVIMDAFK